MLLVIFLRALIAPLFLLATNLLALAATLGLTTWVFHDLQGHDGLTFYVPFAAAVLLVALGSDYNIFSVGHVWQEARHRPLRAALVTAMPQSTRAVTAAGVTLAVSFGLLALVPLVPFRELAFAMAVGILLDALLVRSLLVPALLTLVGPVSGWPGGHLREERASQLRQQRSDRGSGPAPGHPVPAAPAPLPSANIPDKADHPTAEPAAATSRQVSPTPARSDAGETSLTAAVPVAAVIAVLVGALLWRRRTVARREIFSRRSDRAAAVGQGLRERSSGTGKSASSG